MKDNKNIRFQTLLVVISLFFVACSKENSNSSFSRKGEVIINLIGIKSNLFKGERFLNSSKSSIASNRTTSNEIEITEENFNRFSWGLSLESFEKEGLDSKHNNKASSNALSLQNTTERMPMEKGKKFRILFYEISNGDEIYRESAEITVADQRYTMRLAPNTTYKWYAYSYDNTSSIPLPADLISPQINTKTDAPLLYDHGIVSINESEENRVDIEFAHQISKIEVQVNALQVFANNFVSLQAKLNSLPLITKNFSIKQGSLGAEITSSINTSENLVFINDGSPAIKKSTNQLYTAVFTSIPITFSQLIINKSGSNVELINSSDPKQANITGFANDVMSLKRGVVELKYKGGVIDGKEWAQGILYYDPSDINNPYKISEPFLVGTTHACNYYWNWNSILPRSITGNETIQYGDPCREVMPKNTWRTPTNQDFASLNVAIPNNPTNGAVYFNAQNGERVYFHEAGWITNNNCSVSNSNDGIYWSSEAYSTSRGYSLEIDERGGSGTGNEITHYPKNYGMSIKCIRTAP